MASEIYGAKGVNYSPAAERALKKIEDMGFGNLPVCMAKTQYSLSDDQTKLGRPENFDISTVSYTHLDVYKRQILYSA